MPTRNVSTVSLVTREFPKTSVSGLTVAMTRLSLHPESTASREILLKFALLVSHVKLIQYKYDEGYKFALDIENLKIGCTDRL